MASLIRLSLFLSIFRLAPTATLIACSSSSSPAPSPSPAMPPPGAWSASQPLPVARFEAYGAVAAGKVWFLGGITGVIDDISTASPSRRVDVFDPAARAWAPGPDLPDDAPKHHLAVAVAGDAIYVVGGFDGILGQQANEPFRPIAVAYVLAPGAATWKRLAPPPLARGAATAQAIGGKIYVTGGAPTEDEPPYGELDVYDVAADAWTTAAPMPTAREHVASCTLGGKMLVVGGWVGAARTAQHAAELYDPATGAWSAVPPMPTARGGLAATATDDGCHVVGGEDWALPFPGTFGAHEVYDPRTNAWTTRAPMPTARHGLGLAWLGARLYAVGGGPSQGNSYADVVEAWSP